VSRADADPRVVRKNGFHENFRDRQALVRQIVVGQGAGLITVVQEHHPPCAGRRRLTLWNEGKGRLFDAPDGFEIAVSLLDEGGQHSLNVNVRDGGRFVYHGNLKHYFVPDH